VAAIVVAAIAIGGGFLAQRNSKPLTGRQLARDLLSEAPIPPGSSATDLSFNSLNGPPSMIGCTPLWDLHRVFQISPSTDWRAFVRTHLPAGATVTESGYSGGPGVPRVYFTEVTLASNQPGKAPRIEYSSVSVGANATALRVDVQVMLPTSRCVTHLSESPLAGVGPATVVGQTYQCAGVVVRPDNWTGMVMLRQHGATVSEQQVNVRYTTFRLRAQPGRYELVSTEAPWARRGITLVAGRATRADVGHPCM